LKQLYPFLKTDRLTSQKDISCLFSTGQHVLVFPLLFHFIYSTDDASHIKVVVGVSKKKINKAVGRNLIKRRIREAYRKQLPELKSLSLKGSLILSINYIHDSALPFDVIQKSLTAGLKKVSNSLK
jgi:ribonuclease P protein component